MTNAVTSIIGEGSAASDSAAGVTVAEILAANLGAAGPYRFTIQLSAVAAGAAADVNNVELVLGSSSVIIPFTPAEGIQETVTVDGVLDGSTAAILKTATAGPSTIAYYGWIKAEYLGATGSNRLLR
jgi:hypothetical protein